MEPVDIALVFDRTSSMGKIVKPVRDAAATMVKELKRRNTDSRFAVAAFADYYPLFTPEPLDTPWTLIQDFTPDASAVVAGIGGISLVNGGDGPEAYSRAVYELARLSWRTDATRFAILFGDSYNHPIDPGRDGILGTADDILLPDAIGDVAAAGVVLIGVYDPKIDGVTQMFEALAKGTGGVALPLSRMEDAPKSVLSGLRDKSARVPMIRIPVQFGSWINSVSEGRQKSPVRFSFDVSYRLPAGTLAGRHKGYVTVHLKDKTTTPVAQSDIVLITGWMNQPWIPWLLVPLALLPLLFYLLAPSREVAYELWWRNPSRAARGAGRLLILILVLVFVVVCLHALKKLRADDAPLVSELMEQPARIVELLPFVP